MTQRLSRNDPAKKEKTTLLVLIDGFRPEYIHPSSMPFLNGLTKQGTSGSLDPTPGKTQEAALFMGKHPDTAQIFQPYAYATGIPDKGLLHNNGGLRPTSKGAPGERSSVTGSIVNRRRQGASSSVKPVRIPGRYQGFFEPHQTEVSASDGRVVSGSIFELCKNNGLACQSFEGGDKNDDQDAFTALVRAVREIGSSAFYTITLGALARIGRTHGPLSNVVQVKALRELDQKLASIHAALTSNHDHWDYVVCGTRGMAPVERKVDVLSAVEQADARPGKDYVVYVDDTLVQIWYRSKRGQREIEYRLPKIDGAYAVDDSERRQLRIPRGRLWGDRLLAARPGILFSPSFVQVNGSGSLGASGYLDKETEGHPPMVFASSEFGLDAKKVGLRPMVDMFPTLCQLIGVQPSQPQEGQTLIQGDEFPVWSNKFIQWGSTRVVSDA